MRHSPEYLIHYQSFPLPNGRVTSNPFEAENYFSKIDSLTIRQAKALENNVPSARILKLKGAHFIFLSNENEVITAIKKFVETIK